MASDSSVTNFFDQLRQGETGAIEQLWSRFLPRLAGLARKTLAGRNLRAVEADDVLQSVLVTFWRRAEHGDFTGVWNRNDLWNLLATITVRKALNEARKERAERRGGGRVVDEGAFDNLDQSHGGGLDQQLAVLPTQEFDLWAAELLQLLDDELREIALLRLMEYTNREIADLLGCTERRIERKFEKIRRLWAREVA